MKSNQKTVIGVILCLMFIAALSVFGQTNAAPAFGDDIPGLNVLPAKFRGWFLAVLALSPFVGRAYQAVVSGGGFKKIISAIWLGTNTPKPVEPPKE